MIRALTIAIVIAFALALAACGDDDDGDNPSAAPAGTGPVGSGTPTPEFSAISGPDSDAIAATLTQYTAYISDENWEGMCSLYSVNILRSLTCDQLAAGIQSTAPGYVPGSIDATINNIRVIELQQDTAKVIYDFCLIMGSQDTCYTTTASMFREEGNWLVGFAL